jgi:hypothetical protein
MTMKGYSFNNKIGMSSDEAVTYIKKYFSAYLSNYHLIEDYNIPSGHWGVRFKSNKDEIFISSGRGLLDLEIAVKGQKINAEVVVTEWKQIKVSS